MSLKTFQSADTDRSGSRWRADACLSPSKQGTRNNVYSGMMFRANCKTFCFNQKCVIKVRTSKPVTEDKWSCYVKSCNIADFFVAEYNKLVSNENTSSLNFVTPCVAPVEKVKYAKFVNTKLKRKLEKNEYVLIEEYISGPFQRFTPFNSKISREDLENIEAFSHFTLLKSEFRYVVCNLKGVQQKRDFRFTCPTIHSREQSFGLGDLGQSGIDHFLRHHKCGEMCRRLMERFYPSRIPSAPFEQTEVTGHRESGKESKTLAQSSAHTYDIPMSIMEVEKTGCFQASKSDACLGYSNVERLDFSNSSSNTPDWPSPMSPSFTPWLYFPEPRLVDLSHMTRAMFETHEDTGKRGD